MASEMKKSYDREWVLLMIKAKKMNVTPKEIRKFIHDITINRSQKKCDT